MQRVREPLINIQMRDITLFIAGSLLALTTIVMTIAYPSLHNLLPKIYQPDKRKDDGAYKSAAERANCCVIPSSSSLGKNP